MEALTDTQTHLKNLKLANSLLQMVQREPSNLKEVAQIIKHPFRREFSKYCVILDFALASTGLHTAEFASQHLVQRASSVHQRPEANFPRLHVFCGMALLPAVFSPCL